jgi:hypothetical protein
MHIGPSLSASRLRAKIFHLRRCLPEPEDANAAQSGTHVRRLKAPESDGLLRHGCEVADFTLHAYHPDRFAHLVPGASQGS